MKTKKTIVAILMLVMCLTITNSFAQTKKVSSTMKDCCMMKDGKMMQMKAGKMMPMERDMTMKNGAKCMVNGECVMKDGTKMKMKEGDCMDMNGKMDNCSMMSKDSKGMSGKQSMGTTYTCPMHADVVSDKPGKCPKCGMDLVVKK